MPGKHMPWLAVVVLLAAFTGACAPRVVVSADPATPWSPQPDNGAGAGDAREHETPVAAAKAAPDFSIPRNPEIGAIKPAADISKDKVYSLPQLIDIAQNNNPVTRIAWQQARQAAHAVGMTEAAFLPFISANVIAGRQKYTASLPVPLGTIDQVTTNIEGVSPQVALQWLVFDFGQRNAVRETAQHNATAANVLFNGAHQKIIYDVTRTYFLYGAARNRIRIAEQTLENSGKILKAADERMKAGLGTAVEVAQARQQVAQARFGVVQAQGSERDAYQALLAAMGLSPMTEIRIQGVGTRRLPETIDKPTERIIELALSQRPDVLASYSALRASRAGVSAAQAEFMPKVFLAAIAAHGTTGLNAAGLPTIGQQSSTSGVMVGATVPLFDGGLRAAHLKNAESRVMAAEALFQKTRDEAAREIVVSTNMLRSALASYRAATALTQAATVTYDAALDAYRNGLGNISAAITADSGLLAARQAQADAYTASLVAAANLAFVLGAMTSRDTPAVLFGR